MTCLLCRLIPIKMKNRAQFKCQLSKLPKKVQSMTVAQFFAQVFYLAPPPGVIISMIP